MLDDVLSYLNNYFAVSRIFGDFRIYDGKITYKDGDTIAIKDGQYIRVMDSTFNDGIYKCYEDAPIDFVQDEEFTGAIWLLAIPKKLLDIVEDISAWEEKNGGADSAALSPFSSESFEGYSYSKNTSDSGAITWHSVFKNKLARYRKVK